MDGNGFVHFAMDNYSKFIPKNMEIYCYSGSNLFKDVIKFYYRLFSKLFDLSIVFDSGVPHSKLDTIFERDTKRIFDLKQFNDEILATEGSTSSKRLLPPLLYPSAFEALREENANVQFAIEEADDLIASIAFDKNSYVLSNDSDFYVCPIIGFIPFNHIDIQLEPAELWTDKMNPDRLITIQAAIYSNEQIRRGLNLQSQDLFSLTCSLIGNELVPFFIFDKIMRFEKNLYQYFQIRNYKYSQPYSLKDKIRRLFSLFSQLNDVKTQHLLRGLEDVLRLNQHELGLIVESMASYSPKPLQFASEKHQLYATTTDKSALHVYLRSGILAGHFAEIGFTQFCRSCSAFEDIKKESIFKSTEQIRMWLFVICKHFMFEFNDLTILTTRRQFDKLLKEDVFIPSVDDLSQHLGMEISKQSWHTLSFDIKLKIFTQLLGLNEANNLIDVVVDYCKINVKEPELKQYLKHIIGCYKVVPENIKIKEHEDLLPLYHLSCEIQAIILEISNLAKAIFYNPTKTTYTHEEAAFIMEFGEVSDKFDPCGFVLKCLNSAVVNGKEQKIARAIPMSFDDLVESYVNNK